MEHLYGSTVRILRGMSVRSNGMPTYTWQHIATMKCRLDLVFMRPGRDLLAQVVEAGRAPDRMGVLFCSPLANLRAGDRLHCTEGPVSGTFDLVSVPDQVPGFSDIDHLECQVREVSQTLVEGSVL